MVFTLCLGRASDAECTCEAGATAGGRTPELGRLGVIPLHSLGNGDFLGWRPDGITGRAGTGREWVGTTAWSPGVSVLLLRLGDEEIRK